MSDYTKYITKTASTNDFFQDHLIFLKELEKKPIELTTYGTGNIRVKEIKRLGAVFKHDIYHRDNDGNIMFATRTEDDFYYITWHKTVAKIMRSTYKRNNKLKLSKHGKKYLELEHVVDQFVYLALTTIAQLNWDYIFWRANDSYTHTMQKQQRTIWKMLLDVDYSWIELESFCDFIETYILALPSNLRTKDCFGYSPSYRTVQITFIQIFQTLDLIDVKEKTLEPFGKEIKFRLNKTGKAVLSYFLDNVTIGY